MEKNDAQDYAELIAAEVQELDDALAFLIGDDDAATFDGETFTDPMDVLHHYVEAVALSVAQVMERTYGEDAREDVRAVEVTRTIGGPNAFVTFRGDGYADVRAYWGSDRGTITVHAPYADAELWELMDAYSDAYR